MNLPIRKETAKATRDWTPKQRKEKLNVKQARLAINETKRK